MCHLPGSYLLISTRLKVIIVVVKDCDLVSQPPCRKIAESWPITVAVLDPGLGLGKAQIRSLKLTCTLPSALRIRTNPHSGVRAPDCPKSATAIYHSAAALEPTLSSRRSTRTSTSTHCQLSTTPCRTFLSCYHGPSSPTLPNSLGIFGIRSSRDRFVCLLLWQQFPSVL